MSKDKFTKRKERKRLIRAEMLRRNIRVEEIAAGLKHPNGKPYTVQAIYKGMTSSPRVVLELIKRGIPARLFGKAHPHPSPSPLEGEEDKDHRLEAYATRAAHGSQ